jgi:hypothetical protein
MTFGCQKDAPPNLGCLGFGLGVAFLGFLIMSENLGNLEDLWGPLGGLLLCLFGIWVGVKGGFTRRGKILDFENGHLEVWRKGFRSSSSQIIPLSELDGVSTKKRRGSVSQKRKTSYLVQLVHQGELIVLERHFIAEDAEKQAREIASRAGLAFNDET